MARPKLPLHLSTEQKAELQRLIRAPSTPQKVVRRARIALLAAEGKDNRQIAAELETSHVTVGQWRQRVLDLGLVGLHEAPRPGRPKTLPAAKVQTVLTEVVQPPNVRGGVAGAGRGTAACPVPQCSGCGPPTI